MASDSQLDSKDAEALRERAQNAFDVGDYRSTARLARRLENAESAELRAAGQALLLRVTPDPAMVAVISTCLLFFAWVVVRYSA